MQSEAHVIWNTQAGEAQDDVEKVDREQLT